MIVLAGGDLILPGRVVTGGSLVVEGDRIVDVGAPGGIRAGAGVVDVSGHYVVPGFVDVHVHGILGHDTLDAGGAVTAMAAVLPRYGVTAFCPTSVACGPATLRRFLAAVRGARRAAQSGARVLRAHLESNFINPDYRGAQPSACLRVPPRLDTGRGAALPAGPGGRDAVFAGVAGAEPDDTGDGAFTGDDVLAAIAAHPEEVGIVTVAPELPGGLELVRWLTARGHHASIGHTGADFEQASAAFDAGAARATHLFNRMPPLGHRAPGAAGAVLAREDVSAELICDGYHVHPSIARLAIHAKGPGRVMAITDGTAGSGLAVGSRARLGGRPIRVGDEAAVLDDGTLAGSTLTMDRVFRTLVHAFGVPIADAATMCATTPARSLGLADAGAIVEGAAADLTVLDRGLRVRRTFIGGRQVYPAP